jgi:hypothetical protein
MSEYQNHFDASLSDGTRELTAEELALVAGGLDVGSVLHTAAGYAEAAYKGTLIGYNESAKQPVAGVPGVGQAFVSGAGLGGLIGGLYEHYKGKF